MIDLIRELASKNILVYGDFVLDEFLHGAIDRISREAPVFIVSHERSDYRPGCAANAAANVSALGGNVFACGLVGNDSNGLTLKKELSRLHVNTDGIVGSEGLQTAVKTRVIAGVKHSVRQQIVRIDRLNGAKPGHGKESASIKNHLEALLASAHAVLISDYGIGSLDLETAQWLQRMAISEGIPVLVDSRHRLDSFKGATAMTPNQPEAEALLRRPVENTDDLHEAGAELRRQLSVESLVITRGGDGMTLFGESDPVDIPAYGDDEVVDVTGAGDTVIAAFTLAIAAGAEPLRAAKLANVAGGLTVLKKGTSIVTPEEILHALSKNPVE